MLGGNPKAASSGILPTVTTASGNLVFTFRRIQSSTADTTQLFQYGTNLSGWTDVPIVASGIQVVERVPIPAELIPADAAVEMDAKRAAGYFSEAIPDEAELAIAKGRGLD